MHPKKITRSLTVLSLLLLFSTATAGGTTWLFQVQDIKKAGSDNYIIVLRPLESGTTFPLNCSTLTVHAKYRTSHWIFVKDKNINKQRHNEAISLLKKAHATRSPIRFGPMGEGFGFEEKPTSCRVSSRALSATNINGGKEVYSYYK